MKKKFTLVNRYIGTEYIFSFLVSFVFFFFIFFINQILVLAQKIMLKNVRLNDVLILVVLSIPQFLMYTMPFSSLASASMVIGNFSSQNEILAMRASGIDIKRIFKPIIVLSLVLSGLTVLIADKMIPYTAEAYKDLYSKILTEIPTLELDSFSSTQFGNRIISNGLVEDNVIHNVMILDDSDTSNSRIITASEAQLSVVDIERFIYRIDLKDPKILITDDSSLETYSLAQAEDLTLFLNLNSNASEMAATTPSQMGITQLKGAIEDKAYEQSEIELQHFNSLSSIYYYMGESLLAAENSTVNSDSEYNSISSDISKINRLKKNTNYSFYYQYYRAEYNKKFALSFACTFLVFLAFPISFFRIKYGRLVGFGLSMLLACFYWFFLYFMHTKAVSTAINPAFFIWLPDAIVFIGGLLLLNRVKKN